MERPLFTGTGVSSRFGNEIRTTQLGFAAVLTSAYDAVTGWSWKRQYLDTTIPGLTDPAVQPTGNLAFTIDGNTGTFKSGDLVWLEPSPDGNGFFIIGECCGTGYDYDTRWQHNTDSDGYGPATSGELYTLLKTSLTIPAGSGLVEVEGGIGAVVNHVVADFVGTITYGGLRVAAGIVLLSGTGGSTVCLPPAGTVPVCSGQFLTPPGSNSTGGWGTPPGKPSVDSTNPLDNFSGGEIVNAVLTFGDVLGGVVNPTGGGGVIWNSFTVRGTRSVKFLVTASDTADLVIAWQFATYFSNVAAALVTTIGLGTGSTYLSYRKVCCVDAAVSPPAPAPPVRTAPTDPSLPPGGALHPRLHKGSGFLLPFKDGA